MISAPRRRKPKQLGEAGDETPHYAGHRERLRRRLIAAGAENLPDYELLEVILFVSNPRGDVKPLAKRRFSEFPSELACNQEYAGGLEQGLNDEAEPVVAQREAPVFEHPSIAALHRPAPLTEP
jgi:hypothetical protein